MVGHRAGAFQEGQEGDGALLGEELGTVVGWKVLQCELTVKYLVVRSLYLPQLMWIQPSQILPRSQCASAQQP